VGERRHPELAGLVILSQDVHQVFGGVVPELASRAHLSALPAVVDRALAEAGLARSEEHTSELQSRFDLVCRLLLEKKKKTKLQLLSTKNTKPVLYIATEYFFTSYECYQQTL